MATILQLVNWALLSLGANTISSLTDGSRNANVANAIYAEIIKELLREHPWAFATRRAYLDETAANVLTITGISKANPGVVTYTGTDPKNGDHYKIEDVSGMTEVNDETFAVDNLVAATSFELMDTDTSGYTTYTSGGTATEQIPHADDWEYIFDLPSDCLRILEINEDPDTEYEIEEFRRLLCNEEEADIKYIKYESDPTYWDATFSGLFATRMAVELAIPISGKRSKFQDAVAVYNTKLQMAKTADARERHEIQDDNVFVDARN